VLPVKKNCIKTNACIFIQLNFLRKQFSKNN
jgi:hypothetical protein